MIKSFKQLEYFIKAYMVNDELSVEKSREIVNVLNTKEQIAHLIKAILVDTEYLQKVASRSYTHSNGFDKFVLMTSDKPQYKLRLHIWWKDKDFLPQEHIHNHSWNFSSALITGAFRFQTYQVENNGFEVYHYECGFPKEVEKGQEVQNSDMSYRMQYLGTSILNNVFDTTLSAGNSYSLSHNVLHRITSIPGQVTSTLVLHSQFIRSTSDLFSCQPISNPEEVTVCKFKMAELIDKFEQYISFLE
jgi:hypothetical protein